MAAAPQYLILNAATHSTMITKTEASAFDISPAHSTILILI